MLCLQDVSGVSEVDLAERLRIITVSYTHLTLPTKLEV